MNNDQDSATYDSATYQELVVNMDKPDEEPVKSGFTVSTTDKPTSPQMLETMARLAADPELRRRVEDDIRSRIGYYDRFWIDGIGVGHYQGKLYVTSHGMLTKDSSSGGE